jgi:glycosyltransferase involved in cell wall biosynthesis
VHVLSEKNIWLNALLPFLRGTPIVTTVHDVRYHPGDTGLGSVPQWCTRLFIKQSNAIVVHGKTLREQAIRRLPVDECAIHVIPHVALPFYRDIATSKNWRPARDDSPMVLFFGRIRQYKGIDVLISAAALVASEIAGAQFVIAGQSDQETKPLLANATPPLFDVRDRFISDLEAARLFFEARLIVLPYVEGSQSGVLAIANTFGLPVVATDVGDLGATVIESRAGLVVPPNSPEALAQAIVKLLRDPKRLATARADSLNAAKFEFGPQNVGVKAAATYEKIVEAYRAQRRAPKSLDNRAK